MQLDLTNPDDYEAVLNALRVYLRIKASDAEFANLKGDFDQARKYKKIAAVCTNLLVHKMGVTP